jgi:hypothetical protein
VPSPKPEVKEARYRLVREWVEKHPGEPQIACARALNLSAGTVAAALGRPREKQRQHRDKMKERRADGDLIRDSDGPGRASLWVYVPPACGHSMRTSLDGVVLVLRRRFANRGGDVPDQELEGLFDPAAIRLARLPEYVVEECPDCHQQLPAQGPQESYREFMRRASDDFMRKARTAK